MSMMASQIPSLTMFTQPFIRVQIKENIKAPRHWPLWGKFTGNRWIPLTKGHLRGKCFHLMTSSWSGSTHFLFGHQCHLQLCRPGEERGDVEEGGGEVQRGPQMPSCFRTLWDPRWLHRRTTAVYDQHWSAQTGRWSAGTKSSIS